MTLESHQAVSPMQYLVVNDHPDVLRGKTVGEVLTFLAADRGWEVLAVTGPDAKGRREYLLHRKSRGG